MLGLLRSQSRSASNAIWYVTIGLLLVIWAGLWYYYFLRPEPDPPRYQTFLCVGIILSGVTIASIGFLFGLIGRGAKAADTTVAVTPSAPVVAPVAAGPAEAAVTPGVNPTGAVAPAVTPAVPAVSTGAVPVPTLVK
jgi:hypothetical protein